jgi:hypothetical protein
MFWGNDEIFAPDAASFFPSGIGEPLSLDHEIETKKMCFLVFPDLAHTIEGIMTGGCKVMVRTAK